MDAMQLATLVTELIVIFLLVILLKRQAINADDFPKISAILDGILKLSGVGPVDSSIFARLVAYAKHAVHAVEQMYRNGLIEAEDRKGTAVSMVESFALTDGVQLNGEMVSMVHNLIEAECDLMGHSEIIVKDTFGDDSEDFE